MKKTKRKIAILALMAIFAFSWGAMYSPVRADDNGGGVTVGSPGDPSDGDGGKSTAGKGTKPQPSPSPTTSGGDKSWLQLLMELLW